MTDSIHITPNEFDKNKLTLNTNVFQYNNTFNYALPQYCYDALNTNKLIFETDFYKVSYYKNNNIPNISSMSIIIPNSDALYNMMTEIQNSYNNISSTLFGYKNKKKKNHIYTNVPIVKHSKNSNYDSDEENINDEKQWPAYLNVSFFTNNLSGNEHEIKVKCYLENNEINFTTISDLDNQINFQDHLCKLIIIFDKTWWHKNNNTHGCKFKILQMKFKPDSKPIKLNPAMYFTKNMFHKNKSNDISKYDTKKPNYACEEEEEDGFFTKNMFHKNKFNNIAKCVVKKPNYACEEVDDDEESDVES